VLAAVEVLRTLGDCTAVRALIETDLLLYEPGVDCGFVTWFDIRLVEDMPDDSVQQIGRARAARIHAGQAANCDQDLLEVLDADSGELEALYDVYFEDGDIRADLAEGAGCDLLYIQHVTLEPDWQNRGIELALVRRLCDSLGEGCGLAVVEPESATEAAEWQRMGFQMTMPAEERRCLHLPLAYRQARIVPTPDFSAFKVVPNPPPGRESN
jgi:GNAT superfamily N-acetyltransferase